MRKRILIVEDSRALAMLAARKLQQALDCEILLAHSLAEARVLLDAQTEPIFAAVLDLNLPDAQQGEIVDEVVPRGIHAIVLTGAFGEEARETLLAKQVADYVIKHDSRDFDYIARTIERLERNAKLHVLVVDDSASYRRHICQLLRSQNLLVSEAASGEAALETIAARPEFVLVVTDHVMPGIDGTELTLRLRALHDDSRLAIIGMSTEDDPMLSARFLKFGASDFLRKPFTSEEFTWRIRQNLERIERIAALNQTIKVKNQVLGVAAHDLRNPLGGIKGFSQLLLGAQLGSLSDPQQKLVKNILEASRQMLTLLNELLDISVIESGMLTLRRMEHSLQMLVADRLEQHRLMAQQKQITILDSLGEAPPISCDANRFTQILDNLLSNAIKYSHPGSEIQVRLWQTDQTLRLQVADQGVGIPLEEQEQMFGHFQRLSSQPTAGERSTGLGLAIVKRMVIAHGWRIEVSSTVGQGSTFTLVIPLEESQPSGELI
ncbi:MAG: hybrid sensor histidine kinase/response regulator [Candidatus Melainabacteria bacterium HGW-Melainabacteria-1]|nr:MAG: hybrid sensor histidine kinase/response regulator [Candidatus Melainabacteria bacterium HGW-Melainabacteria-1]